MALSSIQARPAVAFIPLDLTVNSQETSRTRAVVTPRASLACCSVLALTVAGADIDVTVLSGPSPKTVAVISTNQIFARVSVHTGLCRTLISIYLTCFSLPLRRADTLEAVLQVNAGPALSARAGGTFVQIVGAGWTFPAWRTLALEACRELVARTAVGAGTGNTGVLSDLTGLSREAVRTGAVVLVRLGVHAGSTVDAGLVATAVVKIFIAQQATPVPLTVALPGGVAGPVDASRIDDAVVAELALPAVVTLASARVRTASM